MSVLLPPDKHEPLWPAAVIVLGLSLTVSWSLLLGYGLIKLVEYAI
jgi:hypothetical protein